MANPGANKRRFPTEPEDDSLFVHTQLGGDDGGQSGTPLVSPSAGELGATQCSADYLSLLRVATSAASSDSGQTPPGEDGQTPPGKMKPIGRPPALTVDTSVFEVPEPIVPKTPANMRSLQRTEMHATVCAGDLAGTMALLSAGHRVNAQEEHGFTPLHNAAALPNAEARAGLVAALLAHGADVRRRDNEGYSPLHWAAACGHDDVVKLLLSAGAKVGDASETGETALHRASRFARTECIRALLADGACPVRAINRQHESALDVAGKAEKRLNRAARVAVRTLL